MKIIDLLWLSSIIKIRIIGDNLKNALKYYCNFKFCQIDCFLLFLYFFSNPFKISRRFLTERNETDVHTYGETPLTTLEQIVSQFKVNSNDIVYELGCGRGRTCFWLAELIRCRVVGVEYNPTFISRAQKVQKLFAIQNLFFLQEDFFDSDLQNATVIYLYGTCLSETQIKQLHAKFENLSDCVKIITVSYALNEFILDTPFKVIDKLHANFIWGSTEVYLQQKS